MIKEDSWRRKLFMGSFRAGKFDFIVLEIHFRWGSLDEDCAKELSILADYVYSRTEKDATVDRDEPVIDDFNIPAIDSDLYRMVTARGLTMPPGLIDVFGSDVAAKLAKGWFYDQILYNPICIKSIND